jgi:hypothetical protein
MEIISFNPSERIIYYDKPYLDTIKFVRASDISDGKILNKNIKYVEKSLHERYKEFVSLENDILLSLTGNYKVAMVTTPFNNALYANTLVLLRVRSKSVSPEYIYYFFFSDVFKKLINNMMVGSVIRYIRLSELKKIRIPVPAYGLQRQIVRQIKARNSRNKIHQVLKDDVNTLEALTSQLESDTLEFKPSLYVSYTNIKSKFFPILKSIAGFLNSIEGGTLLIGVGDNGNIVGINQDYIQSGNKGYDTWEQTLTNVIKNNLGSHILDNVKVTKMELDGLDVAKIDISYYMSPVFLKYRKNNEDKVGFFVRSMNTTQELDLEKFYELIKSRQY